LDFGRQWHWPFVCCVEICHGPTLKVEAPDGSKVVEDIEMNRGRDYNLKFDATQAGVYKLVCSTHAPTMTAETVVLPTS
jgi:plastocyanin